MEKKYIVNDKGLIKNNYILVQNIVAHIMNPTPHIKIIAMPSSILDNKDEYILLNTVNQLENISNLDTRFILAIVNSKLISWYSYRFIFGLAIRTMHFDNPVTSRIPMPKIDLNNKKDKELHDNTVNFVEQIIKLKKQDKDTTKIEQDIDDIVYKIYKLNKDEINIIKQ